jgi:peptidoglycan/xylan/chitin deacetylase (PgdA/CDA1 family)
LKGYVPENVTMKTMKWPEGKKSAVMFSFDVDGDTTWENGNKGLPYGEQYIKSLSIGQYGPKRCVDRILDKLEQYDVKATFFVPGLTAERYPEVIRHIAAAGHEIGHHGYAHERFAGKTIEEQIEIIEKGQQILRELTGMDVTGFRTPSGDWTNETPKLLYERGFQYSSSMRGDDRPYRTIIDGRETDFIEIPTKWEVDDYVAMAYNMYPAEPAGQDRISCYRDVEDNFLHEFEGHHEYGLCISYMLHPQIIGSPGRIRILDTLLKTITERDDVWIARGKEIADWYRSNHPNREVA